MPSTRRIDFHVIKYKQTYTHNHLTSSHLANKPENQFQTAEYTLAKKAVLLFELPVDCNNCQLTDLQEEEECSSVYVIPQIRSFKRSADDGAVLVFFDM